MIKLHVVFENLQQSWVNTVVLTKNNFEEKLRFTMREIFSYASSSTLHPRQRVSQSVSQSVIVLEERSLELASLFADKR